MANFFLEAAHQPFCQCFPIQLLVCQLGYDAEVPAILEFFKTTVAGAGSRTSARSGEMGSRAVQVIQLQHIRRIQRDRERSKASLCINTEILY